MSASEIAHAFLDPRGRCDRQGLLLIAIVGSVALVRRDLDAKTEAEEALGAMSNVTAQALEPRSGLADPNKPNTGVA